MRGFVLSSVILTAIVAALGVLRAPQLPVTAPVPAPIAAPPVAAGTPEALPPAAPPPVASVPPDRRAAAGGSAIPDAFREDPAFDQRVRQVELARQAKARWDEEVARSGISARDIDERAKRLFQSVALDPVLLEGGRMDGMRITDLGSESPLAREGFAVGDRITRIQDVPLQDPADLVQLMPHLGPRVLFCAERSGAEICREVELEPR